MTQRQYVILAVLGAVMAVAAIGIGQWSTSLYPDGIPDGITVQAPGAGEAEPTTEQTPSTPRDAFNFGASMGLLAVGLLYGMLAAGLLLHAKSKGLPVSRFIYGVVGLAATGFAVSYLIDDYFFA